MSRRIAIPATIIAFLAPTILAIYEVMEWKMPEWLAKALIAIAAIAIIIAIIVMLNGIWVWISPIRKRYALRNPLYREDKPNPLQWLIDIADKQRDNPSTHIVLTDSIWFSYTRDAVLPCLRLKVYYKYFGVHNLIVGHPEGFVVYKGEELPNFIQGGEGGCNVTPEEDIIFDLEIYIPEKFKEDMCTELYSGTGDIRNLSLNKLKAKIQVGNNPKTILWHITPTKMIIRRNG